ncbi:hypothetical protein GCM10025861_24840 [Methanobacterium petrolearium]|nr:hypothetical protein GCM10025861_24840 [Methanobacterium petrolearium]
MFIPPVLHHLIGYIGGGNGETLNTFIFQYSRFIEFFSNFCIFMYAIQIQITNNPIIRPYFNKRFSIGGGTKIKVNGIKIVKSIIKTRIQ